MTAVRGRAAALLVAAALAVSTVVAAAAPAAAVACPTIAVDGTVTPAPSAGVDWSGCVLDGANLTGSLKGARLSGASLRGVTATALDLSYADLTRTDLTGASVTTTSVPSALLVEADLTDSMWTKTNFAFADITGADITRATFGSSLGGVRSAGLVGTPSSLPTGFTLRRGAILGYLARIHDTDLSGLDLAGIDLRNVRIATSSVAGSDFSTASVSGLWLQDADVAGAVFGSASTRVSGRSLTGSPASGPYVVRRGYLVGPGSNLVDTSFADTDLSGLDLTQADLSRAHLVRVDLTGTSLHFAWLTDAVVLDSDVEGADLTASYGGLRTAQLRGVPAALPSGLTLTRGVVIGPSVRISGADLSGLDLSGRSFTEALVTGTTFARSKLVGTSFLRTRVVTTSFDHADLRGADLTDSSLEQASFVGADLRGSLLGGGGLWWTTFESADLTGATGLSTRVVNSWNSWYGATCPDGKPYDRHVGYACTEPLDVTPPTVTLAALPALIKDGRYASVTVPITATDVGTNVADYQAQYRARPAAGGAWSDWVSMYAGGGSIDVGDQSGKRICVRARAKDVAGNWSAWTAARCTTTAVDQGYLLPPPTNSPWRDRDGTSWYGGGYLITSSKGASLTTQTTGSVTSVGLVAGACSTCGSVAVYVGSTKVASWSLQRTTSGRVYLSKRWSTAKVGKVRVVVTSSGKPVRIDALVVSNL